MSDPAAAEGNTLAAGSFRELEHLVRNLGDELSTFRKRAQQAELRLKALGASPAGDASAEERLAELQEENKRLRARLAQASERTRAMLDRVTFLRQQHTLGGEKAS